MTKLLEHVESAATRGARKQAARSHGSMLKVVIVRSNASREVTVSHGSTTKKGTIRIKKRGY